MSQELVQEFRWGGANIRVGMTKDEVLRQIAVSGLPQWGGSMGISSPSKSMTDSDRWDLSFGTATGAAPGGGTLHLEFQEERLVRMRVVYPPYA